MRAAVLLLVLLLAGCATAPVPPVGQDAVDRLAALGRWSLSGRLAVRHDGRGGQGLLFWEQAGKHRYDLRLLDPLGRQQLRVRGGPERVLFEARDGTRRAAVDAESLMRDLLGWSVPLGALSWWVRGLPAPRGEMAGHARLADRFRQDGWLVEILSREAQAGLPLPRRLRISRDNLRLTLVIDEWQFP